jgi:hypothetical protein
MRTTSNPMSLTPLFDRPSVKSPVADPVTMRTELDKLVRNFGFQQITNRDAASVGVDESALLAACARHKAKLVGEWPHLDIRMYQVFA